MAYRHILRALPKRQRQGGEQHRRAGEAQCDPGMFDPVVLSCVCATDTCNNKFINELYVHESCSQFLHDFIKLIETDLLIVKPSDRTQKGRMSSTQVCSKLAHMVRQCEDPDYLCRPAPSSATTAEVAPRHDSKNTTHFQGMLNQSWPTKKRSYSVYHCGNDMGSDSGME